MKWNSSPAAWRAWARRNNLRILRDSTGWGTEGALAGCGEGHPTKWEAARAEWEHMQREADFAAEKEAEMRSRY